MKSEKRVNFGKRKAVLSMALFVVLVSLSIGTASAVTQYYVHPGESIQDAIDAANSSDSIEVYSGTYYETVNVNKQLVLRGVDTGEGKPIVDAGGAGSAIILCADGIVLDGFEVTNAGTGSGSSISQDGSRATVTLPDSAEAGIKVISNGNNIKHNDVINNNWYGIDLHESSNNSIEDNNVSNNNWYGINLESSRNNTISNCTASNNEGGIILFCSNSNTITGNAESNNNGGILITANSSDNVIAGNTVRGNLWYGILLRVSNNNVITGNDFISNTTNVHSANSANFWNSTEPLTYQYNNTTFTSYIGNFWSNYKGPDADGDGLGDTPYVIDSDEDHHPLMSRFENYS
ncbi:nitrous oxidase accessory protein [Methanophagales archaeon]|nr:nitrous oxidase accessory protein [Methanophagales archaeon]